MTVNRRIFLKIGIVSGCSVMSLLSARDVIARWSVDDLKTSESSNMLTQLLNGESAEETDRLRIEIASETYNPALVPVSVYNRFENLESLVLLVDSKDPVVANFRFDGTAVERISTRIRVEAGTSIWAIANADGRYYISRGSVKIKPFNCSPVNSSDKITSPTGN